MEIRQGYIQAEFFERNRRCGWTPRGIRYVEPGESEVFDFFKLSNGVEVGLYRDGTFGNINAKGGGHRPILASYYNEENQLVELNTDYTLVLEIGKTINLKRGDKGISVSLFVDQPVAIESTLVEGIINRLSTSIRSDLLGPVVSPPTLLISAQEVGSLDQGPALL